MLFLQQLLEILHLLPCLFVKQVFNARVSKLWQHVLDVFGDVGLELCPQVC